MKKGSVKLGEVKISWALHWSGSQCAMTGDWDSKRQDDITIDADGASIEDVSRALHAAKQLDWARAEGEMLGPQGTGSTLEAVGINEIGSVMLQIRKDDQDRSVAPASDLAHLDPANYSQAGPEAQAAVAWMRDVARAIRDSNTKRELQDAMYEARQIKVEA